MENKTVILLTGTVNVGGKAFTMLTDPEIRLKQYVDAIHFYLNNTSYPVVFVENSQFDISSHIAQGYKNRLELITFNGNDYPSDKGKGYGELNIIKHAFQFSEFIASSSMTVKITGRYKILNICKLMSDISYSNPDVYVDLSRNLSFADSRFFAADKTFWPYLMELGEFINDTEGFYMEHALSKAVLKFMLQGRKFMPVRYYPVFSGYYGSSNVKYKTNLFYTFIKDIKYQLKAYLFK